MLALEKVHAIPNIDSNSTFRVKGDSLETTIRNEVQKIFTISDNEAYNRLFEFLGQDEIDLKLDAKDLYSQRISHRLSTDDQAYYISKPITFIKNDSILYQQSLKRNLPIFSINLEKIHKGKGFYRNDSLIEKPMDFSKKNYLPITTLHELMKRLQFPEKHNASEQFLLSNDDRKFLLETMYQTPKQQGFQDAEYYDSYVKFFMFGDSKQPIPDHIKIYNKVGYAYGYLTDCAHIVDTKHAVSFTITATIHVNKNQIFNDDTYEYDSIGIPFLAELGRQIHQFYIKKQQNN